MADYHHGVRITEVKDGARFVRTVSTSVIGMVCTSNDADASAFPLNRPVLLTDVRKAIAKAGVNGTLRPALQAIADQCSPLVVVVRVPTGTDDATTTSNVIGGTETGSYTGLSALLAAQVQLGVRPRILGAPGVDTQPVAVALATIAQKLGGMAYVSAGTSANKEDAVLYRKSFAQREVMIVWPDFVAFDTVTNTAKPAYAVARALGLRARIDQEQGWHKTLSNVAVNGVTGLSRDVHWDLQDPNTDAGYLNAGDVTTLINNKGPRFWGSRTCSDDPRFAFESAVRTSQVIADTFAEHCFPDVDSPLTPQRVKDIIESLNAQFRAWKNGGYILGGKCWFDPDANPNESIAAGRLRLSYDYTPVPPMEDLMLSATITDEYISDFASRLST